LRERRCNAEPFRPEKEPSFSSTGDISLVRVPLHCIYYRRATIWAIACYSSVSTQQNDTQASWSLTCLRSQTPLACVWCFSRSATTLSMHVLLRCVLSCSHCPNHTAAYATFKVSTELWGGGCQILEGDRRRVRPKGCGALRRPVPLGIRWPEVGYRGCPYMHTNPDMKKFVFESAVEVSNTFAHKKIADVAALRSSSTREMLVREIDWTMYQALIPEERVSRHRYLGLLESAFNTQPTRASQLPHQQRARAAGVINGQEQSSQVAQRSPRENGGRQEAVGV